MENNYEILVGELAKGKVIGHTTDTVFGLMVPFNVVNVTKINELKGRDSKQPLQVLVSSISQLEPFAKNIGSIGKVEMKTSYIVEASDLFNKYFPDSYNNSIMFKLVDGDLGKIIKNVGPLFASSANKHGEDVLTKWKDVEETFSVITNKKDQPEGSPSTIVSLLNNERKIIRGN